MKKEGGSNFGSAKRARPRVVIKKIKKTESTGGRGRGGGVCNSPQPS